ncbi:hypothetical protein DDF62_24060 [Caulobacter radicis]|uniref:hypothetical protein n=1 Tax=Caulobacter radicis TaxID=2172650 RepID=UPI000D57C7A3|nr:hypothetical protein [Caulobacter radicis]PVM84075.1 hypothetical protein DDF62_24060 [Caulobacter radicis]
MFVSTTRLAVAAGMILMVAACAPPAKPASDPRVDAVIERSRTTRATYAVYAWVRVERPNEGAMEEWSTEFHSGDKHRVETPADRVVADCATGTGKTLTIATGEILAGPEYARAACGVNSNRPILEKAYVGSRGTPTGRVDRIRLTDAGLIRIYDIDQNGVIVGTTFKLRHENNRTVLSMLKVVVEGDLPATDIFDHASLQRSVVPDRYKVAPKS